MIDITPENVAAAVAGFLTTLGVLKGKKHLWDEKGEKKCPPPTNGKNQEWTKEMHDEICTLKLRPIYKGIERIEGTLRRMEDREASKHE